MDGRAVVLTQMEDFLLFCNIIGYGWQNSLGILIDLVGFMVLTIAALKAANLTSRASKQTDAMAVQARLASVTEHQAAAEADLLSQMGNSRDSYAARLRGRKQGNWHLSEAHRHEAEARTLSLLAYRFETNIALWGVTLVLVGYFFQLAGSLSCPA